MISPMSADASRREVTDPERGACARVDMLAEQLLSPDEGEPLEESGEEAVCVPASSRSGRFGGKGFGLLASIALTTNNICNLPNFSI